MVARTRGVSESKGFLAAGARFELATYEFNTWFWMDGAIGKNQSHTVSMCVIVSTVFLDLLLPIC
jgi:hypothetical protein